MRADLVRKQPTEKQFMAQVVALAKLHGWRVYHTYDSRKCVPGFPDLVLLRRNVVVVSELKTGSNTPTPEQTAWLQSWRDCGAIVRVWTPDLWSDIESVLSEG